MHQVRRHWSQGPDGPKCAHCIHLGFLRQYDDRGRCCVDYVNAVMGSKERIEVAELSQGDVFGEMAALTDEPRKASVLAKGHVMVQKISQRTINDQFLKNGDAMEAFAAFMAHREARRCEFTADQTETYELDLVERMRKTFARLFSSG